MINDRVTDLRSVVKKGLPYNHIKLQRYISPGHIWSITWLNVGKKWFHDELVKMTDKKWCNKSEVSWQKLPPYKICWATWRFLSWSQTNKTAEKLRVANISGWHHSGAVWPHISKKQVVAKCLKVLMLFKNLFLKRGLHASRKWFTLPIQNLELVF